MGCGAMWLCVFCRTAYTVKYNQVVAKFAAKLEKDAQEAAASTGAPSGASGEEEAERLKGEGEGVSCPCVHIVGV